jgi:iron complex transport system substrate-binding protein
MRSLSLRAFPLLAVLLVLGACQLAAPSPTPSAGVLSLTDDEGTTVTLPAMPRTIVSLTPATTELLYALGAGDRLRGRTNYDDYPPAASALPVVATFEGVQIEDVVAIAPDLVIAGGNNFTAAGDVTRLRELGIPVLVVYAADVDGVLADIRVVGKAVGEDQAAAGVVGDIQARINEVTAAVSSLDRPRTFYEIGYQPDIYGPAPDSFVADVVNLAGGDPITTTDPAVFSISLERLVTLDPQVIVLGDAAYGTCPDGVVGRAGWAGMTAVLDGQVRPVDDLIVTRPGPRLGEGLAALALAIHPDAAIAPPTAGSDYCPGL